MPSPRSASDNNSGEHPNKRVKRTHTPAAKLNHTPPPSPGVQDSIEKDDSAASLDAKTIDLDAVNDEIVQAVIVRLQETSNRPHLVKDLSTALMGQVKVVQQYVSPSPIPISLPLPTHPCVRACVRASELFIFYFHHYSLS